MASIPAPGKTLVLTHRSGAEYAQKCEAYRGLTACLTRSLLPEPGIQELPDLPPQFPLQPGEEMISSGYLHLADTGAAFGLGA